MSNSLQVTILGSGGSPGVPMPGCDCSVCRSEHPHDQRTRCSALLGWQGRNILIDTATDLRQQALREGVERIDAVLLTHTHADHLHGIDDLRPFNRKLDGPIPIYASPDCIDHLQRVFPYIFTDPMAEGYRPRLELHPFTPAEPLELFGLPILPLPLPHGGGTAHGFRIGSFAYLTDCSALPDAVLRQLQGVEELIIDGLRWRPHTTHFNIPQAVAAAQQVGAARVILTHLNHEVDARRDGARLPDGVELAYDGMRLEIAL